MIAVTGANGLLGSFIIRKLIEQKETFVAIGRENCDTSILKDIESHITWRYADINDPISLTEALEGVTHLIHTAAIVSFNPRDSKKIFDTNVLGTRNVVDACLDVGITRLVYISSVAALGRQKNQMLINEQNKWVDSPLNSTYAKSKYAGELEIFRGQEEGLNTIIVNPSVILAPTDWNRSSSQLFKYVWQEKPFYIDGSLNYVDVRDVARAVSQLLHSPLQNDRFILSAGQLSFNDFFKAISKQFGKKAPRIKLNKTFIKIAASLEAFRSLITGSNPLITRETARLANTQFVYENNKIRKALNFEFQTIDQTLQWCCEHYIKKINGKK
ncbi:MAG TPA: NAD-dependent epimerase/dehydratase family protein [Cyclobacteriaceae bacterium]|nr:NAD-dependent epimerase/dehydratase family protein [Cyclobacteriaceae bacterium]